MPSVNSPPSRTVFTKSWEGAVKAAKRKVSALFGDANQLNRAENTKHRLSQDLNVNKTYLSQAKVGTPRYASLQAKVRNLEAKLARATDSYNSAKKKHDLLFPKIADKRSPVSEPKNARSAGVKNPRTGKVKEPPRWVVESQSPQVLASYQAITAARKTLDAAFSLEKPAAPIEQRRRVLARLPNLETIFEPQKRTDVSDVVKMNLIQEFHGLADAKRASLTVHPDKAPRGEPADITETCQSITTFILWKPT